MIVQDVNKAIIVINKVSEIKTRMMYAKLDIFVNKELDQIICQHRVEYQVHTASFKCKLIQQVELHA